MGVNRSLHELGTGAAKWRRNENVARKMDELFASIHCKKRSIYEKRVSHQ